MTNSRLPDLISFATVARLRSFRGAALELGVSASALSHAVRGLEERLGVRLLNRTTRSVTPSEAGQRLLERLGPALRDIDEALDEVNSFRDTPIGTLRLNVPRAAAHLVLAPLMARYLVAYPQMRLEITTDDGLVDIVAGGYDAGVRFGESLQGDMVAVPLGPPQRMVVVASPSYLAEHGAPAKPRDLRDHACVRFRFPSGKFYRWEFAKGKQVLEIEVDGPLALGEAELMIRAAEDGVGLACALDAQVEPRVQSGKLVRVLEDWCPVIPGFYLYYPSRRQMAGGLRAFVEMIRADAAD